MFFPFTFFYFLFTFSFEKMGKGFVVVYVVLLWLRWMMASLPGYIHPDEFFQSPEITARAVLKVDTLIPWEFHSDYAARSILIP
jgi:phosphatidylinositol glycan class Z